MNRLWPRQDTFIAKVSEYCRRSGLTTRRGAVDWEAAARVFNVSHVTLRQFMQYRGRCRPRTDTLTSIAARIGCSVADFLDNPGDAPPGIPPDRWNEMGERERALAAEMLANMSAADLTLTEKEELLLVHREAKARLLRLRK